MGFRQVGEHFGEALLQDGGFRQLKQPLARFFAFPGAMEHGRLYHEYSKRARRAAGCAADHKFQANNLIWLHKI